MVRVKGGDPILDMRLRTLIEGVVSRSQIGELGLSAPTHGRDRGQHRISERVMFIGGIGVPIRIADVEKSHLVPAVHHFAVFVDIGNVGDGVMAEARRDAVRQLSLQAGIQWPELRGESNLLLQRQWLMRKD